MSVTPVYSSNLAVGAPATAFIFANGTQVFATQPDNTGWNAYNRAGNEPWLSSYLGSNPIFGTPCAVSWTYGHVDVFNRAINNKLIHTYWNQSDGQPWRQQFVAQDVTFLGDFTCVSRSLHNIDVLGRGTDNALYHLQYNDMSINTATPWTKLPGTWGSSPSVVRSGSAGQDLTVFVAGEDDQIWYHSFSNTSGSWSQSAQVMPGSFAADQVTAVSDSNGNMNVFSRDRNNYIQGNFFNSSSNAWNSAWTQTSQKKTLMKPSAVTWGAGRITLAFTGSDYNNLVYVKQMNNALSDQKSELLVNPNYTATAAPALFPDGGVNSWVFIRNLASTLVQLGFTLPSS